ncbi:serine/threonine protein kinase [Blastomyces gilchristii SLH14081]|uniref:Serine/threonine protein kinase n=1 Tax=Blastomyces gilchristii (strain SLH14081) TaxID=559298 RepID=A0A179U894_BLAGS|nr:serine/threonine protein kinase [Blastomyces gilchristii SLH14081]OAT04040.1 serine/threonine protein kinase [Blastomyces gilchristii SLH14081]
MAISIFDRPGSLTQQCIPMPNLQKTPPSKRSMWHRFRFPWMPKSSRRSSSGGSRSFRDATCYNNENSDVSSQSDNYNNNNRPRPVSGGVEVGLPRHTTFKRQNSEQRERLYPTEAGCRRALSVDARRARSRHRTRSPPPVRAARLSAPEVQYNDQDLTIPSWVDNSPLHAPNQYGYGTYTDGTFSVDGEEAEDMLEKEMDSRWILNLSMHFRDRSEREKFFVTYAETPNRWLRVTVSCDYRNAEPESLERDLKKLYYQRDKNARIYESIRDSLPEIQFYDTVTNLRLETREGRLHVHVTEDMNEIIPYPPISTIEYLGLDLVRESDLSFVSHLSGFAYQVKLDGKDYVKKEIPGPDMVNEFLYEINALHSLIGSRSVIQLKAIVVDDDMFTTKGLLINFAKRGSLVELIYDYKGTIEWSRRTRWARQIIEGLAEIHEAGFVQGDLTVSNIVVDANDDAKIIDINRRGCPVGWEAPEFTKLLQSKQKISMYIGVKSDLYQLGMTLWALAMEIDEPGSQPRPFIIPIDMKVPDYYRTIVDICLSTSPQKRLPAKELLGLFPQDSTIVPQELAASSLEALVLPPVEIPDDCGYQDDSPSIWNHEYLEQPANDIKLTSGPKSLRDSEDVIFFDPCIDHGPQRFPSEFRELNGQFGEFHIGDNPLEFPTKEGSIELESPSRAGLCSEMHNTLAFESSLDEIYSGVKPPISCGIRCSIMMPNDQNSEPQLREELTPSHDGVESDGQKIYHIPTEVVEMTEPLVQHTPFSQSFSSILLESSLPINPAFPLSIVPKDIRHSNPDSEVPTPTEMNSPDSLMDSSRQQDTGSGRGDSLLISKLPINPAFKDPSELEQQDDVPIELELSVNLAVSSPEPVKQDDLLFTSKLPINPAFKDYHLEQEHNSHSFCSNIILDEGPSIPSRPDTPTLQTEITSHHDFRTDDLFVSKLPINPAFKDFNFEQEQRNSGSFCSNIILDEGPSIPSWPDTPALQTDFIGQHNSRTDDLFVSKLPINPAFKDFHFEQEPWNSSSFCSNTILDEGPSIHSKAGYPSPSIRANFTT